MSRKNRSRSGRMTISAKERLKVNKLRWSTPRHQATAYTVVGRDVDALGNVTVSDRLQTGLLLNVLSSFKDSTNTSNYRALVKSGGTLPTNSLLYTSEERGTPFVAISDNLVRPDGSTSSTVILGSVADSFILNGGNVQTLRSEAQLTCGEKLVDKISNQTFSTGVFLGELGETVSTVTTSARGLYRSYQALRRGDVGTAATVLTDLTSGRYDFRKKVDYDRYIRLHRDHSWLRAMEDLWLTWRYGYRLIAQDVEDAILAYEAHVIDPATGASLGRDKDSLRVVKTVRRSRRNTISQQTSVEGKVLNGHLEEAIDLSVTCGAVYRVVNPSLRTANQLGLANVSAVAWNLMPWTFVIDWILPVGQWLEAQSFDAGLEFVRGWTTSRSKHTISGVANTPPPGATWSGTVEYPPQIGRLYHRQPYTPSVAALAIQSGIPDSTQKAIARALDAISLLDGVRRQPTMPRQKRSSGFLDYFDF